MSEEKQLQNDSVQDQAAQGTPMQDQGTFQNEGLQGSSVQPESGQQNMPGPKKMKRGAQVAIVIAAVLLIGIAGFAAGKIYQAVQKANMSPTEYYQYATKKTRDAKLEDMTAYYGVSRKAMTGEQANKEIGLSVQISDTAKSMISLAGLDVNSIKNIGLHAVYGMKGNDALADLALKVNDEDLLTGKAAINMKDKKGYIQVPELSPAYLDVSKSLSAITDDTQEGRLMYGNMGNPANFLPEDKELEEFILCYSNIFIDSAKNVEKKEETTVKVEDISEKSTTYTFTMKNDGVIKMLGEYVKALEKDKVMKKMLGSLDEEVYASYVEELQEAEEQIASTFSEEAMGEVKITVEAQIGSDDRIVGQKFILENAGQQLGSLSINAPRDENKFGEEVVLQAQGKDLFRLAGSGTNESEVYNGEFKLGVDSSFLEGSNLVNTDELLVIKIQDYDCSKLAEGKVEGKYTLSTSAVSALANCSLAVEQKGDVNDMKQTIKVMMGKDSLVTVDMTSKGNATLPEVSPSDSDKVYDISNNDDIVAYQSELNITGLFQNIQEKTGIDISSLLELPSLGDEGLTDPGDAMID